MKSQTTGGNSPQTPPVVNLERAFGTFQECWSPRIAGEVNEMYVKLAKLQGEFVWHSHATEDELFLVIRGRLKMNLRAGAKEIGPGEFLIVPHGVEHCPQALTDEVHVLLLEPKTTLNTGTERNERTVETLKHLSSP